MANRFNLLVENLAERLTELSPEVIVALREALTYAGYEGAGAAVAAATTAPKAEGKAAKTGYQLFFTAKNAELTPQFPGRKDRQPQLKAAWQALTKEEKEAWSTKAKGAVPAWSGGSRPLQVTQVEEGSHFGLEPLHGRALEEGCR